MSRRMTRTMSRRPPTWGLSAASARAPADMGFPASPQLPV